MKPRIVLGGGSGFIGQSLSRFLVSKGYEVIVLTRAESDHRGAVPNAHWTAKPWVIGFSSLTAQPQWWNLTGRSINCRHTSENRREIIDSRHRFRACPRPGDWPMRAAAESFVQVAGVGIYGDKANAFVTRPLRPETTSDQGV